MFKKQVPEYSFHHRIYKSEMKGRRDETEEEGTDTKGGYMTKLNCWEWKKCGREPGGVRVSKLGVCPATIEEKTDGMNTGKNGGRACWAISGTLCEGKVQGTLAMKIGGCMKCDFYQAVQKEEGADFQSAGQILKRMKE